MPGWTVRARAACSSTRAAPAATPAPAETPPADIPPGTPLPAAPPATTPPAPPPKAPPAPAPPPAPPSCALWHRLYLRPLPHQHGSFDFGIVTTTSTVPARRSFQGRGGRARR